MNNNWFAKDVEALEVAKEAHRQWQIANNTVTTDD